MTYYEFQDLLTGVSSQLSTIASTFFTVFVAYLVCVYFVGSKLSKMQAISITIVYSAYTFLNVFLFYGQVNRYRDIVVEYLRLETTPSIGPGIAIFLIFGIGWILSLIYMYQVHRESQNEQKGESNR